MHKAEKMLEKAKNNVMGNLDRKRTQNVQRLSRRTRPHVDRRRMV